MLLMHIHLTGIWSGLFVHFAWLLIMITAIDRSNEYEHDDGISYRYC